MIATASKRLAPLAVLAALAACAGAQTPEEARAALREATAGALGIADPASITVTGEARANAKWTWKAAVAGLAYACDADDQMRLPSCVEES